MALIKQNVTGQVATYNLPMFATEKEDKRILKMIEKAYQKITEPKANPTDLEYIERYDKEIVYVNTTEPTSVLLIANATMTDSELIYARNQLRLKVGVEEGNFFIGRY